MGVIPRRLRGYLLGRAVVLTALLALVVGFGQGGGATSPMPTDWFFAVAAASLAFSLVAALGAGHAPVALGARVQVGWDLACATALVYLSGGAFSPFATLYPLGIIGGAILLGRREALLAATAASLAYGALVNLQLYGVLRPPGALVGAHEAAAKFLPHLSFHVGAFFALAVLAGSLAEELRRTGARLEEAEAEVLDLEHLQASVLASLGSGLVAVDRRGREVFHNRAAEELLGRAGVPLAAGTDLSGAFDLAAGERREVAVGAGPLTLGYSVSPLWDRGGRRRGSILIFQDLSEVKQLEANLRRADRLAAVGRLAAGLAHEIRNPLASLSGSVEVLRQGPEAGEEARILFGIVLRETERLNRLVTNFLHYARPDRAESAPFGLAELVDETAFFFQQGEGRSGFRVVNRVPPDLVLTADRSQVEQLLLNLFRNSIEASPEGVTATVEGETAPGAVRVTVRDDGPGMLPEVAAHAFEPFFSRRPGGTGLGLATVDRIVENHGATVVLEAAPGAGVALHFRFPAPVGEPQG